MTQVCPTRQLCLSWCLAPQMVILEYKRRHPQEEGRLRVLRVPPPLHKRKQAAPESGVLALNDSGEAPMYSYDESLQWAHDTLFLALPKARPATFARLSFVLSAVPSFLLTPADGGFLLASRWCQRSPYLSGSCIEYVRIPCLS